MSIYKHLLAFSIMAIFCSSMPLTSYAQEQDYHVVIVNHFDQPLTYTVTIHPEVIPDFPKTFVLNQGEVLASSVVEGQYEGYIKADGPSANQKAFWGVEVQNKQVKIHGYIGKNIAYSWKQGTITFCTPEVYKEHRKCI